MQLEYIMRIQSESESQGRGEKDGSGVKDGSGERIERKK
jgi:hypothetical protein